MKQIYNYTAAGHYVSTTTARVDPLDASRFLIPANATTVVPPIVGENEIAKWMGTAWGIVGDFRGEWYDKDTQAHTKVWYPEESAPPNATTVAPPVDQPTWVFTGTVWERTLEVAKAEKKAELIVASAEARSTPFESDGHFYSLFDDFMLFLWAVLQGSGQLEVYDIEEEISLMSKPKVEDLLEAIQAAAVAIELNRVRRLHDVAMANDIPTVDNINW